MYFRLGFINPDLSRCLSFGKEVFAVTKMMSKKEYGGLHCSLIQKLSGMLTLRNHFNDFKSECCFNQKYLVVHEVLSVLIVCFCIFLVVRMSVFFHVFGQL